MDDDQAPPQLAPAWSTQANASSADEDNDSVEFVTRSVEGDDVEMDEAHDSGAGLQATPTRTLVRRLAGAEEDEAMDVLPTVVERGHPSLNEVQAQGLGPVEEIDLEVFRVETRSLSSGSVATKEVVVCKYCEEEFPYLVREVDQHKSTCEKYKQQSGEATDVAAMEDAELVDAPLGADEEDQAHGSQKAAGRSEMSSAGGSSDGVEQTDDEEESVKEGRAGDQESVEEDDDETQLLDSEPGPETVSHREDEELPPRVALAAVGQQPDQGESGVEASMSVSGDADAQAKDLAQPSAVRNASDDEDQADEGGFPAEDMDTGGHEGEAVEEGSIGHGSTLSDVNGDGDGSSASTPNTQFRAISDTRVECVYCEKTFANRGSGQTKHRKKCRPPKPTPQDRATTRDENLQAMTPQKKPVKRRISQELDKLESGVTDADYENPYGLRSLKRSKTDTGVGKPSEAAVSTAIVAVPGTTTSGGTSAARVEPPARLPDQRTPSKRADSPMMQFDLVGDSAHAKRMTCKHCKGDVAFDFHQAKKHLASCDAYTTFIGAPATLAAKRGMESSAGEQTSQKQSKALVALLNRSGDAATGRAKQSLMRRLEELTAEEILAMDADALRAWIFDSPDKAVEMERHFGASPCMVRGLASRFNAIAGVLYGLDVKKVLETTVFGTQFTVATLESPTNALASGEDAWVNYQRGAAIAFRPPEIVARMLVPQLAEDVGCGMFVPAEKHGVKLVCSQQPFQLDWRFDEGDSFVVCLQGKFVWKMKEGLVATPAVDFIAPSGTTRELVSKLKTQMSATKAGTPVDAFIPPTDSSFDFTGGDDSDDDEDMEDASQPSGQGPNLTKKPFVVDAGSVVYVPPGTWYKCAVLDHGPSIFVKIQLKSGGVDDTVVQAAREVVKNCEWRARARSAAKCAGPSRQRLVNEVISDAIVKLQSMKPTEIMPQLWRGVVDASPTEVVFDDDGRVVTKVYVFDLTGRHGFQAGQHLHLLDGPMFRVNPLSIMFTSEEIACYSKGTPTAVSSGVVTSTATGKKALHRKQKRSANSATTSGAGGSGCDFVYAWGSEDAAQMQVQFRCTKAQGVVVEWIRTCGTTDPFHVEQLKMLFAVEQGATQDLELLDQLLRFLHVIGYVTDVEDP